MIARWWRSDRAPNEQWQLLALRQNGTWTTLALIQGRKQDGKPGWCASACIRPGGKGSTWIGSEVRTLHRRRGDAFRAAERMCGFSGPVRHATWPAICVRKWYYAPSVQRVRQRARAGSEARLTAFQASLAQLVTDVIAVRRGASLDETKARMDRVIHDIARGDLSRAEARLESTIVEHGDPHRVALIQARKTLATYTKARKAVHE